MHAGLEAVCDSAGHCSGTLEHAKADQSVQRKQGIMAADRMNG